jgi:hypothetical protein
MPRGSRMRKLCSKQCSIYEYRFRRVSSAYIRMTLSSRTRLPRGVRMAQARGKITRPGRHHGSQMSKSSSRRFPVTVTQLPVTRCEICHHTVAYRPGSLSEIQTEHCRRAHPEALGIPSR